MKILKHCGGLLISLKYEENVRLIAMSYRETKCDAVRISDFDSPKPKISSVFPLTLLETIP